MASNEKTEDWSRLIELLRDPTIDDEDELIEGFTGEVLEALGDEVLRYVWDSGGAGGGGVVAVWRLGAGYWRPREEDFGWDGPYSSLEDAASYAILVTDAWRELRCSCPVEWVVPLLAFGGGTNPLGGPVGDGADWGEPESVRINGRDWPVADLKAMQAKSREAGRTAGPDEDREAKPLREAAIEILEGGVPPGRRAACRGLLKTLEYRLKELEDKEEVDE